MGFCLDCVALNEQFTDRTFVFTVHLDCVCPHFRNKQFADLIVIVSLFTVFLAGLQAVTGRRDDIDVINDIIGRRNNDMRLDDLTAVDIEFSFRNRLDNTAAKVLRDSSHEIARLLHLICDQIIRTRKFSACITGSPIFKAVTFLQAVCNILDCFYSVFLQCVVIVPAEGINICFIYRGERIDGILQIFLGLCQINTFPLCLSVCKKENSILISG